VNGQNKNDYNKEFSFTTENDFYALKSNDSYYTNGLFLQFSKAKSIKGKKVISRLELGQTMFTQQHTGDTWRALEPEDRPFCGYLFLKYSKEKFLSRSNIFSYKLELGVTGELSLAQSLQESLHKVLKFSGYFPQWETQIPNSVGLNAGIKYVSTIAYKKADQSSYKIVPVVEANAGNYFINAKAGAYFCIGKFEKLDNSVLLNSRINTCEIKTKRDYELLLYYYPQIILQGYNATIQGDLFAKNLPAIVFVSNPETIMLQNTFGIAFAKKRWTTRVEAVYQTKEAVSQLNNHEYIGLQTAYRF
jgi:hypothetical protein